MADYGFTSLGLRRIRATVHEPNSRSRAFLSKLGFREARTLDDLDDFMGELVPVVEFVLTR